MGSTFYELDCGEDEPVVMEVVAPGEIIFHGWDQEAELAAVELGFEPSACFVVWDAAHNVGLEPALWIAAGDGHAAVVEALLAAGAYVHVNDDYALRLAAKNGHADVVEVLLSSGANVHAEDDLAFRWAAMFGNLNVVEVLLAAGADVRAADDYALRAAIDYGHPDVVQILEAWIEEHG